MKRFVSLVLTLAALAAAAPAGASTIAKFGGAKLTFPDGWADCRCKNPGLRLNGPGGAYIQVLSGYAGRADDVAGKALASVGGEDIVNEEGVSIGGQVGYAIAAIGKTGDIIAVGAVGGDVGGLAVILVTPTESYETGLMAWGGIIDSISFDRAAGGGGGDGAYGGAAYGGATYGGYGDADVAPTKYTVTLRNVMRGCTAPLSIDGQEDSLPPGATKRVQLTGGAHEIRAQNADGSWVDGSFDVPDYSEFTFGCVEKSTPPARGSGGATPTPTPTPRSAPSEADLVEGAKYFLTIFYMASNMVADEDIFEVNDKVYGQRVPPIVAEARKNAQMAEWLLMMPQAYMELRSAWKDASTEQERDSITLECAQYLHNWTNGQWVNVSGSCPESNDGRFCGVIKIRRELAAKKKAAASEAKFWADANATAMMIGINYNMMFPMAVY